jgi:hypothetical protein
MPRFLAPATPSELLAYIVTHQTYPTTLIVCCPRPEFQIALLHNVTSTLSSEEQPAEADAGGLSSSQEQRTRVLKALVSAPLYQTAVAKHIRVLFMPTVSHLRAYLSVFSPSDSKVPAPPSYEAPESRCSTPLLLLYGFLDAHRDTSEWNAQGISCTASILVDAAYRTSYTPIVVEPKGDDGHPGLDTLLSESVPLLGGATTGEGVWSGRTVDVRQILGRWFKFYDGPLS